MSTMTRILCLCLLIISGAYLYGQGGANGTILGTVTDNSGAVLANAGSTSPMLRPGDGSYPDQSSGDFRCPI